MARCASPSTTSASSLSSGSAPGASPTRTPSVPTTSSVVDGARLEVVGEIEQRLQASGADRDRARGVRVLVGADEDVVAPALVAAGQVRLADAEVIEGELGERVEILVGTVALNTTPTSAGLASSAARKQLAWRRRARCPTRRRRRPDMGAARRSRVHALVGHAALVAHPVLVDGLVDARDEAVDLARATSGRRCCSRSRSPCRRTASRRAPRRASRSGSPSR